MSDKQAITMRLLFVYNADAGLFSTMADAAHKIFSPRTYQCDLCMITHGWFQERVEWRAFIEELAVDCEFLHRDQFRARYPDLSIPLPAVLRLGEGAPEVCIDQATLASHGDVRALIALVRDRCGGTDAPVT